MNIKILSYNVHKGFSLFNRRYYFDHLPEAIGALEPDLVFLQEIHGSHPLWHPRCQTPSQQSPMEDLADRLWSNYAYGKNAVYKKGDHGNAILSRYPFDFSRNLNVSTNPLEKRGILHGIVTQPETGEKIAVFCVHFDLLERGRQKQLEILLLWLDEYLHQDIPVIVAGDFNDWRGRAAQLLEQSGLQLQEAFQTVHGEHARTFPSALPVLTLDRIYLANFAVQDAQVLRGHPWVEMSDHCPLLVGVTSVSQLS